MLSNHLEKLAKIATSLDLNGFTRCADLIDKIVREAAVNQALYKWLDKNRFSKIFDQVMAMKAAPDDMSKHLYLRNFFQGISWLADSLASATPEELEQFKRTIQARWKTAEEIKELRFKLALLVRRLAEWGQSGPQAKMFLDWNDDLIQLPKLLLV